MLEIYIKWYFEIIVFKCIFKNFKKIKVYLFRLASYRFVVRFLEYFYL